MSNRGPHRLVLYNDCMGPLQGRPSRPFALIANKKDHKIATLFGVHVRAHKRQGANIVRFADGKALETKKRNERLGSSVPRFAPDTVSAWDVDPKNEAYA